MVCPPPHDQVAEWITRSDTFLDKAQARLLWILTLFCPVPPHFRPHNILILGRGVPEQKCAADNSSSINGCSAVPPRAVTACLFATMGKRPMPVMSKEDVDKLDNMDHAIVAILLFVMLSFLIREGIKYVTGRRRIFKLQRDVQAFDSGEGKCPCRYHCLQSLTGAQNVRNDSSLLAADANAEEHAD